MRVCSLASYTLGGLVLMPTLEQMSIVNHNPCGFYPNGLWLRWIAALWDLHTLKEYPFVHTMPGILIAGQSYCDNPSSYEEVDVQELLQLLQSSFASSSISSVFSLPPDRPCASVCGFPAICLMSQSNNFILAIHRVTNAPKNSFAGRLSWGTIVFASISTTK